MPLQTCSRSRSSVTVLLDVVASNSQVATVAVDAAVADLLQALFYAPLYPAGQTRFGC